MSHIRLHVLVQLSRVPSRLQNEAAWTPEPSIEMALFTFDRFSARKVFSGSSLSWLLWWSSSLCCVPSDLVATDAALTILIYWILFSSCFYSFPSATPAIESHRQSVADHRAEGAFVRKSLETPNRAREKSENLPAVPKPTQSPPTAAEPRVGAETKSSSRQSASQIRVLSIWQRREWPWRRHWRRWRRNDGNGRRRRPPNYSEWWQQQQRGQQKTQATSFILESSDFWTWSEIPPAALLVSARTGTSRVTHSIDTHASQDLVPKPPLQDETRRARERNRSPPPSPSKHQRRQSSLASTCGCASPGEKRKTLHGGLERNPSVFPSSSELYGNLIASRISTFNQFLLLKLNTVAELPNILGLRFNCIQLCWILICKK